MEVKLTLILFNPKMKLGQVLVSSMTNTCNMFLAGYRKVVPGPFMILLKSQYSEI